MNIPFEWEDVEIHKVKLKINNTIPVYGTIDKEKRKQFLFCKHTSRSYSVEKWRDFIFETFPEMKNL